MFTLDIVISRPQYKVSSPDPACEVKKKTIEAQRDNLKADEVFYYADELNVSWQPTLKAMWSPEGQQIMVPTSGQPTKHDGMGGVNYHTGETDVSFRRRKRRPQMAEFLQRLLDNHPHETIYAAWDNVNTHQDDEVEAVARSDAGRLTAVGYVGYK